MIGLCGFATTHGLEMVRFAQIKAALDSHEIAVDAIRLWIGTAGLTSGALKMVLLNTANVTDAHRRAADVTGLLAVRPLSGADWLSLAGMQPATEHPDAGVAVTLTMSSIAGPNEGDLMAQRGLFGLLRWEVLPIDRRQRTISDLAGALHDSIFYDSTVNFAKNTLKAKPSDVRSEIANLLRAVGSSPHELIRLGL